MVHIRKGKKEDLPILATIYEAVYASIPMGEYWTKESALAMVEYFYHVQPDLFLVAYIDEIPVGAIMSIIKPYWNGMNLSDTEVFVDSTHQGLQIGRHLIQKHLELAIQNHNATYMNAHTYKSESGYPLAWYEKLGYEVVDSLLILNGNIETVLAKIKE